MDFREIWGELGSKMEWAVEKIHILRADVFTLWLKRPLYSQMRVTQLHSVTVFFEDDILLVYSRKDELRGVFNLYVRYMGNIEIENTW